MAALTKFIGAALKRHQRTIEYGGESFDFWVKEPSVEEIEKAAGKGDAAIVSVLIYESEEATAPMFTAEQFSGLPIQLGTALSKEVAEVIAPSKKKS